MVRPRLLLALLIAGCGQADPPLPAKSQPAQRPQESKPARTPWTLQGAPEGPGHLHEGGLRGSAYVATLQALLPNTTWFEALEPDSRVTATLARPVDGAVHHRLHGILREGSSWPDPDRRGVPCASIGALTCVDLAWGKAYVRTEGRALTVDLITHGDPTPEVVLAATQAPSTPSATPPLGGDAVLHIETTKLAAALAQAQPPAFDHASIELTQDPRLLRARLRWTPPNPWTPSVSNTAAPSWDALCSGALACVRTGPWPNIHAWLQSLGTTARPQGSGLLAASLWSGTWPHELAATVATLREQSPEVSRGFIDVALAGLAEVEFSGARLDKDGVFIAFVRIPAAWVNFAASVLPYAGLTPGPQRVGSTEITWAPLQHGGIALALDDEPDPTMGWVVFASSPERFAWLMDTPRTGAHASALTARITRIDRVAKSLPPAWRSWLAPYADRTATLWVGAEDGQLSLSADLAAP